MPTLFEGSMKPIIRVSNVSKQYRIGKNQPDRTLREALSEAVRTPIKRLLQRSHSSEAIWALRDVSFEVQPGEVVAIIGSNGAGKSTLLKILSRITEPTKGRIELYGNVGSLLEVGTGFHPELTGRENIYLNGAILGMPRSEIAHKFDEIVEFSEIARFIDTAVKYYSSGMYLRLAFSVSAHLDPEVLILDEVLAVGDADFQIKCFNKMQEIRNDGRTILFVSHNMQAVTRLCKRAILLSDGAVVADGPTDMVASAYLNSGLRVPPEREWNNPYEAPGNEIARLRAVRVRTAEGQVSRIVDIRKPVGIEMEFEVLQSGHVLTPNFHFYNESGVYLFVTGDLDPSARSARPAGRYSSTVWIPGNFLAEGTLRVGSALSSPEPVVVHFYATDVVAFQVVDTHEGGSVRGDYKGPMPGVIRPELPWTTQYTPNHQAEQWLVGEGSVL